MLSLHRAFALIASGALGFSCGVVVHAQQAELPMWPFDETSYDSTEPAADPGDQNQRPWMLRSRLVNIGWPDVQLPRYRLLPRLRETEREFILGQNGPSLLETVAYAPRRLANRARVAWNRSLDRLKVMRSSNGQDRGQPARRRPAFGWLFGSDPQEPDTPLTINEWISQERLKP